MNKLDKFINWACGKTDEFPFFKDFEEVEMPKMSEEHEYNLDGSPRSEVDELIQRYGI